VTDSTTAALRREYDAIARQLEGAPGAAEREAAKREIIGFFKKVDGMLGELGQLKEDIRQLVDKYKQLNADTKQAPEFTGQRPVVHADHIGATTFIEKGWSLISLGEEDVKGNEMTKEVFKMLKKSSLNFVGNIEGRHLFEDPVEVVVCDGFVGNVILKTCESISVAIFQWLKHELSRTPMRKVGAFLARESFRTIKDKTNYEEYGGSPLLGVNGICIIAHGSSTPLAVKNALRVAAESIEHQVNPHIIEEVQRYHEATAPLEAAIR